MFNLTISQVLVMLAFGALMTPLAVSYVPHVRRTNWFDLFLWVATWFIGFLGAWLGLGYWSDGVGIPALDDFVIADVPILPVFLGAAAGAFLLNLSLFVLDRIPHPGLDHEQREGEMEWEEEPESAEEGSTGEGEPANIGAQEPGSMGEGAEREIAKNGENAQAEADELGTGGSVTG